jgi:ribosomal 50S subunit-recycling heat shock protein
MRLDLFLKVSRLVTRRTLAQEMCEGGAVEVNGIRAKSAREIRAGDVISLRQRGRITRVRVVEIPARQLSKTQAASVYEIISVERYDTEI